MPLELYLAPGPSDTADSLNDGRLTEAPHSGGGADSYVYDPAVPVRTLGGSMIGYPWYGPEYEGFSGPFDQRPVEPRCLTYTGAPLARDMEASGPIKATLFVSTSAPDTDWVVRLSDVSPDGAVRPVAEGILRARYRESSTVERCRNPARFMKSRSIFGLQATCSAKVTASGSWSRVAGFQDGTGTSTPAARSQRSPKACLRRTKSILAAGGPRTSR